MTRSFLTAAVAAMALSFASASALAADSSDMQAPPPAPYKAVSTLVKLPNFIPGLGTLYVDPATLPAGPFLGYDHDGHLVDTVYMIPLAQMKAGMNIKDLKAPAGTVDHVEIMYNAGHPGVPEPHIHVILWNVPVAQESRVAK